MCAVTPGRVANVVQVGRNHRRNLRIADWFNASVKRPQNVPSLAKGIHYLGGAMCRIQKQGGKAVEVFLEEECSN